MKTIFALLTAFFFALVACSSSEESATPPEPKLTPAEEADFAGRVCDAYGGRREACGQDPERDPCAQATGLCYARTLRREGLTRFVECMKGATCSTENGCSCTKSDDDCFHEAGIALAPSPIRDSYLTACRTKLAECGKESDSFSDDFCTYGGFGMELYSDALYQALTPCFQNACGNRTIGNCLTQKRVEVSSGACVK